MKTLMIVSGGDAPGINTTIAHFIASATAQGDQVMGAMGGLPGLTERESEIAPLTIDALMPWMGRAGSYLRSSRDPVLSQTDAESRFRTLRQAHQIDNIVLFGGNGSLRHIPPLFNNWGIPYVGIPTTIDNDVPGTEETLGFDSACNYAYHSIDGALLTAHALRGRMFMIETLGGNTGFIALAVAAGAGAHVALMPEFAYEENWLAARLLSAVEVSGYALMVLSEGTPGARTLADDLPKLTGIRMRDIRLGHAQRGASPSHRDRVLASQMARSAYTALREGILSGVTVVRGGKMTIHEGLLPDVPVLPDRALYDRINGLV